MKVESSIIVFEYMSLRDGMLAVKIKGSLNLEIEFVARLKYLCLLACFRIR